MEGDVCRLCGGDGRIGNALGGSTASCPGCHGSGRRADTSSRFHDVTKTKPSHYSREDPGPKGPKAPTTLEGARLADGNIRDTIVDKRGRKQTVVLMGPERRLLKMMQTKQALQDPKRRAQLYQSLHVYAQKANLAPAQK